MNSNEQIIEKFQHIYEVVSSKSFQKMDALGGEIPFWIASYEISKNSLVEIEIKNLTKRLLNEDVNSLVVNTLLNNKTSLIFPCNDSNPLSLVAEIAVEAPKRT